MISPLKLVVWSVGRLLYPIRGHASGQFIECIAFADFPEPNMILECNECGPSGSKLHIHHTTMADNGKGVIPVLHWNGPNGKQPEEYVLICEDIDSPVPFRVRHLGLFWGISGDRTQVTPMSIIQPLYGAPWMTSDSFCLPTSRGDSYAGANPFYGHGKHRCVFTIVGLKAPLQFRDPAKVTKKDVQVALVGMVMGWGQWVGEAKKSLSH